MLNEKIINSAQSARNRSVSRERIVLKRRTARLGGYASMKGGEKI